MEETLARIPKAQFPQGALLLRATNRDFKENGIPRDFDGLNSNVLKVSISSEIEEVREWVFWGSPTLNVWIKIDQNGSDQGGALVPEVRAKIIEAGKTAPSWTTVGALCEQHCVQQKDDCSMYVMTKMGGERGIGFLSPSESLVPNDIYWNSKVAKQQLLERIGHFGVENGKMSCLAPAFGDEP